MPAGDLVVADYHLELRGLLHGPGTRFHWTGPWTGLGLPPTKTNDVDLQDADGAYPGRDRLSTRVLTFPVGWGGTTPAAAMNDLRTLADAWSPEASTTIELHAQLPGWGRFFVVGRPRGLIDDLTNLKAGEAVALLTFHALDPTIYYPDGPGS